MTAMQNLGILLSGRGSNFEAIADSVAAGKLPANISIVISNREEAAGISAARRRGLPVEVIPSTGMKREQHEAAVIAALQAAKVDWVCLAGYLRLLSPLFVRGFAERILNIHPSLLPAFPGLGAQQQALEHGVKITGCTVHFVDESLDHGPIIMQKAVSVLPSDTLEALEARILEQEHILYSQALALVLSGDWKVEGRRVFSRS